LLPPLRGGREGRSCSAVTPYKRAPHVTLSSVAPPCVSLFLVATPITACLAPACSIVLGQAARRAAPLRALHSARQVGHQMRESLHPPPCAGCPSSLYSKWVSHVPPPSIGTGPPEYPGLRRRPHRFFTNTAFHQKRCRTAPRRGRRSGPAEAAVLSASLPFRSTVDDHRRPVVLLESASANRTLGRSAPVTTAFGRPARNAGGRSVSR